MLISLMLAAQATEPAAPPPPRPEIHYVRVAGAEAGAMKLFAAFAETSGAAQRVRPAAIDAPPFERCVETPSGRMHGIDTECIRALLPETGAQPPVIALAVLENRRSNITGRVVLKSHTIYCVGPRAVGYDTLNDPLDGRGAELGVQSRVDKCIADALSSERIAEMRRGPDGSALWRYAFLPDRLAENERVALGSSHGVATIRVQRIGRGPDGSCTVRASIEEVERGPGLRRGDAVEIAWPGSCNDAHPMTAPLARRGGLFRFYGAWGGGVRYIEPVVTPAH